MNVERYLKRIGISGTVSPAVEHLRLLQHRHMLSVPFENIDIYYGIPVEYSLESFYRKIVTKGRGGYCYELNGLFHWLLTSLGYDTTLVSALVMGKKDFITEFEHMVIIVEVEGSKWLVDVGFGDSSLAPIKLFPGIIQNDGRNDYRVMDDIIVDGKICMSLERYNRRSHSFVPLYYFTFERKTLDYFIIMHGYQEVMPTAYYKGILICSLPTNEGRISIVNNRVIETKNGVKRIRTIDNVEEHARLFKEFFDIDILPDSDTNHNRRLIAAVGGPADIGNSVVAEFIKVIS